MKKNVQDAASFYEAIRFNPAISADESKIHVEILQGIEKDWIKALAAGGVKGPRRDRFLIWNGALVGYLMALKAIKRSGDATLAAEGKLREN